MATDEQISAVRDYSRAVFEAHERRSYWRDLSAEVLKVLRARAKELKEETTTEFVVLQHGEWNELALQLGFGAQPVLRSREGAIRAETGATMVVNLTRNGFVRFAFFPSRIDGDRERDAEVLGEVDPFRALDAIDQYLTMFLRRATETHWAHVKVKP